MKIVTIKRGITGLVFLAHSFFATPLRATGLSTGPSLGFSGFYTTFETNQSKEITIKNLVFQLGWFAKLDLLLLYAKLDPSFAFDMHTLPSKTDKTYFTYIAFPFTIGVPFFGLLRPHIGLMFRIPLGDFRNQKFTSNDLVESYRKTINGYLLGISFDVSSFLLDIYWEIGCSQVDRRSISRSLLQAYKLHRPMQCSLKISYNLLA